MKLRSAITAVWPEQDSNLHRLRELHWLFKGWASQNATPAALPLSYPANCGLSRRHRCLKLTLCIYANEPFIRARMLVLLLIASQTLRKETTLWTGTLYPYFRPTLDRVHGWDPRLLIGYRRRRRMEPAIDLSRRSALPILSYSALPVSPGCLTETKT